MYLIPVDIDQFRTVIALNVQYNKNHIYMKIMYIKHNYIPRELFNMIQIIKINFSLFTHFSAFYDISSAAINHNSCNWNNLRKLVLAFNLSTFLVSEYGKKYTRAKINNVPSSNKFIKD